MYKLHYAVLLLLSLNAPAQTYFYNSFSWEKTPVVYAPTESEKKTDLVIVAEKKIHEIVYDSDGQAVLYETIHHIYHVNNTKAIDRINKGYMPLGGILEELDLKARCITPENKIIYFNKSSVKSVDNLEGAGPYKIFAIDGVEAGCDVEILYTNKRSLSSYQYYTIQASSPIVSFEARIISPKNLLFETKTYNGLENFRSDTSDAKKNQLFTVQKNIPAVEDEKYSADKANYMSFIYQLVYNADKKKSRLYTWDVISREFYAALYTSEKTELKAIEKLIDKNKISKLASASEKIKALDSYFKTTYEMSDSYDALPLGKALEAKKMSDNNSLRFYISSLNYMQIPFELVLTGDRDNIRFDPKFPSYLNTKEFVLFFPELNQYLSPLNLYSRLGYPAPELLSNDGLFIKEVSVGDILSSSARVKPLAATNYTSSYHNFDVKATLDFDSKTAKLNVTQSLFGYLAYYVQPVYRYLTNEQKEDLKKNYQLSDNTEGIKDFEVLNTSESDLYMKPMTVKFNSEQNDFLENAGNKFIFKAGLLIGPQAELYQEEKRRWPGEMTYTHYLSRTLEINIPPGYKATNLNDLVIQKSCVLEGKEIASFRSSFELKENKILVQVYEDYRAIVYPLSVFDAFRAVINAAADFNKKSVIFEKL